MERKIIVANPIDDVSEISEYYSLKIHLSKGKNLNKKMIDRYKYLCDRYEYGGEIND